MGEQHASIIHAVARMPRWRVVHWGSRESSTLMCLWVAGRETLLPVDEGTATYNGMTYPVDDGQLPELLRRIEQDKDRAALSMPAARAAREWLLSSWARTNDDGEMGIWRFPRGGFLRWIHNGILHIEAGEGGGYHQAMPEPLVEVLVALGWNPPNADYRNCWLQPLPAEREQCADLAVLTPMAAFGFEAPPSWR